MHFTKLREGIGLALTHLSGGAPALVGKPATKKRWK
jgi:hypothetical protein